MFFQTRRYVLYFIVWLIFAVLFLILNNSAWSQPNQDCVYKNNIFYNSNGQIVNAKQTYECKTPQPPLVVEKIVYKDQLENSLQIPYNDNVEEPVTFNDIVTGLYVLGSLLGANN